MTQRRTDRCDGLARSELLDGCQLAKFMTQRRTDRCDGLARSELLDVGGGLLEDRKVYLFPGDDRRAAVCESDRGPNHWASIVRRDVDPRARIGKNSSAFRVSGVQERYSVSRFNDRRDINDAGLEQL